MIKDRRLLASYEKAYDDTTVLNDRDVYDAAAVMRAIALDVLNGRVVPKHLYYFLMAQALIYENSLKQLRDVGLLPEADRTVLE